MLEGHGASGRSGEAENFFGRSFEDEVLDDAQNATIKAKKAVLDVKSRKLASDILTHSEATTKARSAVKRTQLPPANIATAVGSVSPDVAAFVEASVAKGHTQAVVRAVKQQNAKVTR